MKNIFGSIGPKIGPGGTLNRLGVSPGLRYGESGRSWCGLPKQPPQFSFDGRVAIQRGIRFGKNDAGQIVPIDFFSPEFVSERQALHLVSNGLARYCGQLGESK